MNLRKVASGQTEAPLACDLQAMVDAAVALPDVAERGVQGVHAEIMRRLMSDGRSDFPAFSDVRALLRTR